jgi:hypothetical protein
MFAITSITVVQVIALVTNIVLITIVFTYAKARYKNLFILFLTISLFWSFTSLIVNTVLHCKGGGIIRKSSARFYLGHWAYRRQ